MRVSSGLLVLASFFGVIGLAAGLGIATSVLGDGGDSHKVYACVNQDTGLIRAVEGVYVCQDYEEQVELSTGVYGDDSDGGFSIAGLSIKTRIVRESTTLGRDKRTLTVFCGDDEVATGGGFDQSSDYDIEMGFLSSLPVSVATSTGWSVTGHNKTGRHQKMTVFVVCSSLTHFAWS